MASPQALKDEIIKDCQPAQFSQSQRSDASENRASKSNEINLDEVLSQPPPLSDIVRKEPIVQASAPGGERVAGPSEVDHKKLLQVS